MFFCKPTGAQTLDKKNFRPLENGSYIKIHTYLPGQHPVFRDMVVIRLYKYSPDGQLLFSTTQFDDGPGIEMELKPSKIPGDITDAFLELAPGDSATVFVPRWIADHDSSLMPLEEYYRFEIKLVSFTARSDFEVKKQSKLMSLKTRETNLFESYIRKLPFKSQVFRDSSGVIVLKRHKTHKTSLLKPGDSVTVHYRCIRFDDQKEVDNSYLRNQTFTFVVGNGDVIKGWDSALQYLSKGEKATIFVPSWCAYGERGAGADIPPDCPLMFEIEIIP